jgi:hypothetical protein
MQSIQNMTAMSVKNNDSMTPSMRVTMEDSGNADRPSFKKGLGSITSSLAKELNQLSLTERDKAYYDLHGVADVIEEN